MIPSTMSPAAAVFALSILCGFFLKTSLGYGFCWLIARFSTSPALRFLVWLFFLGLTSAFWICSMSVVSSRIWMGATGKVATSTLQTGRHGVELSSGDVKTAGLLLSVAFVLYLSVLVLMAVAGAWRRVQLARALSYRSEPTGTLDRVFGGVAAEVGAPRCRLWVLPGLTSPASLGWLRPAIYLPVDDRSEESTDLYDILCHELAHVRRRDSLWESLARLCRWVVCFHPLVHRACASLRLEREMACDLAVVRRHPEKRDEYADTLVRFGWRTSVAGRPDRVGIGFTSQASVLNTRVRSILEGERVYSRWSSGVRTVLVTAACWGFATIAPALWIGFHVLAVPPAMRGVVALNAPMSRTSARQVRSHGKTESVSHEQTGSSSFVSAPQPPQMAHVGSGVAGFPVQNADEPMSNPVYDAEATSASGVPGAAKAGRPGAPSATKVVMDTATQLSRMGLGHDHDHGHD